jgi:hypothetical protein
MQDYGGLNMVAVPEGQKRFFVEVMAQTPEAVRRLHSFGVDLFRTTAREDPDAGYRIDGLMALEEIGKLVEAGYPVLIHEEASKRARATEVSDFVQWLDSRKA